MERIRCKRRSKSVAPRRAPRFSTAVYNYMQHVPGCYVRFDTAVEGVEQFPAHSSRFDFDERAIAVGAAYYRAIATAAAKTMRASR